MILGLTIIGGLVMINTEMGIIGWAF